MSFPQLGIERGKCRKEIVILIEPQAARRRGDNGRNRGLTIGRVAGKSAKGVEATLRRLVFFFAESPAEITLRR